MRQKIPEHQATHFPEPFNYYAQIIEGHLHFGCWPEDEPELSLEEAQDNLFNMLLSNLPKPPATILDVGCGFGKASLELAEMGYVVTAISPDGEMVEYAKKIHCHPNLAYIVADFLSLAKDQGNTEKFDAVFMQESLQYLRPLDEVFQAAETILSENGLVVLCDEICQDASIVKLTAVHRLADVIVSAYKNSFYFKKREFIGRQVRKTCDEVLHRLDGLKKKYVNKSEEIPTALNHLISGWTMQKEWYADSAFNYTLMVLIKSKLRISAYASGDEQDILPAFNQIFGTKRTMDHWIWKFRQNPFGREKIALTKNNEDKIVAQFAGYPAYFHDGKSRPEEFLVYQAGDTMTMPEFRNVGHGSNSILARTLDCYCHRFCVDQVPVMYGFNSGKIRKLGERFLGYEYTRPIPYHILQIDYLNASKRQRLYQTISGYSVECVNNVDDKWDRFFKKVSMNYGLLTKRDRKYLQWRYLDCPDNVHTLIAVRKFGILVGWGVFTKKEDVIIWGDALFDKRYDAAVKILLSYATNKVFGGCARIEAWFSPVPVWWTDVLSKIGFSIATEPNDLTPCFMFFDPRFTREYMDNNFYYTYGDSDLF